MPKAALIALLAAILSVAESLAAEQQKTVPNCVRYRGIFVNDEDWGLRPWAVRHFVVDKMESTWKIKE